MSRKTVTELNASIGPIARFVREHRKILGYTQIQLAENTGVGLRFLRELERGKASLRLDKVNQVLEYFGFELTPTAKKRINPFEGEL
jgi:y4mF family transcriptional regulator